MQKKISRTGTNLLIAVALAVLAFAPICSQAAMLPADGDLGALGNGDSASFAEIGIDQGTNIATEFEFDYEGTGAVYIAAASPRLPEGGPSFFFGIDDFRFTVGTAGSPIWDSVILQDDIVGRIITAQELADANIAFGTTLVITMLGEAVGSFSNSYSGDVAVVVPIPAAAWLLGSGLIGLLGLRRRFNN